MGFVTAGYFLFFPLAALFYFLLPERAKNPWLLACSWFFYLCAGWRYFPFLLATVLLTYFGARGLEKRRSRRLLALLLLLFVGVLFLFKYLGFALSLLGGLLGAVGLDWSPRLPALLLPAGISFYFFTAMGYLIDVYRGKVAAQRSFVRCALFLSFFPYLLSGPIGRAESLLPQLTSPHRPFSYDRVKEGLFRFLWGAFKKLVIADRLAVVVGAVFAAPGSFGVIQVLAAVCAFSLQIYCDFSAYSDMAVGSAKAMGFDIIENFRTPYFSHSIAEFWRRWHISLSTWFRDYLYIPLGGNRRHQALNILIVFAVSGLWHGAALTFLIWGLLNGVYQILGRYTGQVRGRLRSAVGLREGRAVTALWQMLWVFVLSTTAWVFFQASSVGNALDVFRALFSGTLWVSPLSAMGLGRRECLVAAGGVLLLVVVDALSLRMEVAQRVAQGHRWVRWCVYLGLLLLTVIFGSYGAGYDAQSFIYGQF